jgi:hypothetical protein
MQQQYLTVDDLITRWGKVVTRGTLANWRSKRVGPPFVKLRARVVYPVAELVVWEKKNQRGETNGANDNE